MRHLILLAIGYLFSLSLNAQDCDCEKELKFVINYYEDNLPGFKDNVNAENIELYNEFKDDLLKLSKNYCANEQYCFKVLLTYVEFFRDNHSSIYRGHRILVDESNEEEVKKFINSKIYTECEIINDFQIKENSSLNDIENVYQTSDGIYTVAVIKNKNEFRDYVGIIVDSKTPLWKKGQVKFELKKIDPHTFNMFTYSQTHSMYYKKNVKFNNGIFDIWFNKNLNSKISRSINVIPKELTFKELDDETNYIYIPSFSGKLYEEINKFYKKNDSIIQSKPYLIIDVRNNGGGSDRNVSPLLKYIYTKPFYSDTISLYSTKGNIERYSNFYESISKDSINFDKKYLTHVSNEIERMKSVPNKTFIPRSKGSLVSLDTILETPKKVAIITNRYCASSCETLLFWALESDKTSIFGENSGGFVGYGENFVTNTPNFNFKLSCTMTRYQKQRKYEVIGISPKYYLNNKEDWIEQTLKILKK